MPYRRRRYNRRRRRRKPAVPWYARKYSAMQLAAKAWKTGKYLKTIVNAEKKKFDVVTSSTVSTTPVIVHINAIAQGDDDHSRDGNSILMHSLSIRAKMTLNAATTAVQQSGRFILVRDSQQIGDTSPAVTDVLTTQSFQSFLNPDTVGRFTILVDRMMAVSSDRPTIDFQINQKVNKHARFNGANSNDIQKNGLFLLWFGDAATNVPSFDITTRVNFYDN